MADLEIRVPRRLPPANQRLMDYLGVRVVIDPTAPAYCYCGCRDVDNVRRREKGRSRAHILPATEGTG